MFNFTFCWESRFCGEWKKVSTHLNGFVLHNILHAFSFSRIGFWMHKVWFAISYNLSWFIFYYSIFVVLIKLFVVLQGVDIYMMSQIFVKHLGVKCHHISKGIMANLTSKLFLYPESVTTWFVIHFGERHFPISSLAYFRGLKAEVGWNAEG